MGFLYAAKPEAGESQRDGGEDHNHGSGGEPPAPAPAGGEGRHRRGESLLALAQPARVTLLPQAELAVGGAGPEPIVVATVLVPRSSGLAEFVAELRALLVLGVPADEAWPIGEQRLVDDLDPANRLVLVLVDLIRGEEARVDELSDDLGGRIAGG